MALWQEGGYFDGGGRGGREAVLGFLQQRRGRHTHTHARTHTSTSKTPPFLPWAFSTNTTLESCWKLCPSRRILSPPGAGHVSRLCLSTSGNSWADLWAVGGRREENRPHRSANTHPLPMQTWASRPRLNHYLDSSRSAAGRSCKPPPLYVRITLPLCQ